MPLVDASASRRRFLKFLAGSPLFAWAGSRAFAHESPSRLPDPMMWAPRDMGELIKNPQDAINVFDFEPAPMRFASGGRIYGASARSVRRASSAYSN